MSTPKYVERISRLPRVFEHLAVHPDGLPLRELAQSFHVPPDTLREDLLAFYAADVGPDVLMGLSRPSVLEFLGPDGREADPNDAEIVRVSDPRHVDELGVEHVDASELALIYTAATALLDVEPDNDDLAAAVDVLAETMLGQAAGGVAAGPAPWNRLVEPLAHAEREQLRVDIVYSRAFEPGVSSRTIEPYRLVRTRRGWEVDAGPLDDNGDMRTYLLTNIREAIVRDDHFDLPDDLPGLLAADRRTTVARVEIPQSARWAADMYAERVTVVDDGELAVVLELELLPPLRHRLGLLVLAAGPTARILEPADLVDCPGELARTLLDHHRGAPSR
jgi:proteasome accessory factor C